LQDQQQLEDFMLSIGQTEALAQLEQRNLTWPKLKNAQESDVLNAGLPKRVAAAIVEGLKLDTSTKLYALANRPRVVVNLDARSVEIDYEAVADADLPPLPREPPPMSSRIEYKNYMRLRYEHQRRGLLEAVSPRGSGRPGPAPPSPTMTDGPKSPRKRPQRAAPPPPTDVPAFEVIVQMRKSGAPLPASAAAVASPQMERAAPPVSPTVPPKPARKEEAKKEEPKKAAPKENTVAPDEEEIHEKASPNPQRLTEMFATMEAKLNLQTKMKAEAQKDAKKEDAKQQVAKKEEEPKKAESKKKEEPKKEEPKKAEAKKAEPKKEAKSTTNLSEMLDGIEDDVAGLDKVLKPADTSVAAMRKSHLEELSEVLADADEFDVGPQLPDSFFDSTLEKKKDESDWEDLAPAAEKKAGAGESEDSRSSLPYPSKPLPRETNASEIYASEVYADLAIPKRGSAVTEPSVSTEAKRDSDNNDSDDDTASLKRLAPGGNGESESEEMGLPIVLASGAEVDSELPSLPPVGSDDDDE
jgi:hypothetical protein